MPKMFDINRRWFFGTALLVAVVLIPARGQSAEAAFISAMNTAMVRMMAAMHIQPSHDVDRDFVDMMVPHHRGAIAMAEAELRYGHNEQTRRLAQEIIVTQQEEIAALRLSVGESIKER
ncbi:MAG TPA: DUF305 domain-containing protein [Candidatus Cybelea sp.]|nr:DUF305 domain-containing protein [Candidatus Cybelea sp.]